MVRLNKAERNQKITENKKEVNRSGGVLMDRTIMKRKFHYSYQRTWDVAAMRRMNPQEVADILFSKEM